MAGRTARRRVLRILARTRLGLAGWVLYPTREENVAGIAANREALQRDFLVPTPELAVTRCAWDKREAYGLASRLSIPAASIA